MKIAFLDRDGTINKDYPDHEWRYINEPEILAGVLEALKAIRQKGYQIIIITNQYLINDAIITLSQYQEFTNKLLQELYKNEINILDIFYCPHSKKENCNCFKPKTVLIDMALKQYPQIQLDKSFLVGDSITDIELGNKIGIKTFGINVKTELFKYIQINSLIEIVEYL